MASGRDGTTTAGASGSTASINAAADPLLIRKSDIRPLDILVGRGHFKSPGNIRFLQIVARHQTNYKAAPYADKERIAREVLEDIISGGGGGDDGDGDGGVAEDGAGGVGIGSAAAAPPARFLQLEPNQDPKDDASLWGVMTDEKAILYKIKMNLRQKTRWVGPGSGESATSTSSGWGSDAGGLGLAAESGGACQTTVKRPLKVHLNSRHRPTGSPGVAAGAAKSVARSAAGANDIQIGMAGGSLPQQHALHDLRPSLDQGSIGVVGQLSDDDQGGGASTVHVSPAAQGIPVPGVPLAPLSLSSSLSPSWHGNGTTAQHGTPPATPLNNRRQFLLQVLQLARNRLQTLRSRQYNSDDDMPTEDLHSLGMEMYDALTREDALGLCSSAGSITKRGGLGEPSIISGEDEGRSAKRRDGGERQNAAGGERARPPLIDFGYPVNFSLFVECLLNYRRSGYANGEDDDDDDDDDDTKAVNIQELDEEVAMMVEDPDKYLFGDPTLNSNLCIPNTLYGQQVPIAKLLGAFQSVFVTRNDARGLVLISGRAGSGKSSLVETLRDPLAQVGGQLIPIKFNSQGTGQPVAVIFGAFDKYCVDLQQGVNLELFIEIGARVKSNLGSMCQLLTAQMPNLAGLVGVSSPSMQLQLECRETYNLLQYALQAFARAIATPSHPLVMVFDDLQWADAETLNLVKKLATEHDAPAHSTLCIGCYREEGAADNNELSEGLVDLSLSGISTWNIFMETLDKVSINELLRDTLRLPPRLTEPLAKEVFNKTRGNPMFIRQLLEALCREELLSYSASERRWRWNIGKIRSMKIPDSAVELVLERMKTYSAEVLWALKIAALIGNRFDASTMQLFHAGGDSGGDGSSILTTIDQLLEDGIICLDGANFRFNHDVLWQAAYALTPSSDLERTHLFIGQRLLKGASSHSKESIEIHIHVIVDQMNRGAMFLQGRDEKLRLAEFNLQVGSKSVKSFEFLQASIYFLQGTVLLDDDAWETDYDLALDLYAGCTETQLALGNFSSVVISSNPILLHAKCLRDKLQAYFALIMALTAHNEMDEALEHCWDVLAALGEPLPAADSVDQLTVKAELERTKDLLSMLQMEEIVNLASLTDDNKIYAIRFLVLASRSLWSSNRSQLYTITMLRCVNITVVHGLTPEASISFSSYANILYSMGLMDASAAFARVSMVLLKKYRNRHASTVHLLLNISILPFQQPLQACSDISLSSYEDTIATGITEWALMALCSSAIIELSAPNGRSMDELVERYRWIIGEMKARGHYFAAQMSLLLLVLVTLTRNDGPDVVQDPSLLRVQDLDAEEMAKVRNLPRNERRIMFCRMLLAYLFRNYEATLEVASVMRQLHLAKVFFTSFEFIQEAFYLGLVGFWIVRRGGDDADGTWLSFARDITAKIKGWAETGSSWNFGHKFHLLVAEQAFVENKAELAMVSYDKAIQEAKEHKFVNEVALASECAGLWYLDQGHLGMARQYLSSAEEAYRNWGALRKADDVRSKLPS